MFRLVDGCRSITTLVGGQAANLRTGLRVHGTGVFYSEAVAEGQFEVLQALAITGPP